LPLRICSVDFLNSSPLVWGLLHGPQRGKYQLDFAIPSILSERLKNGLADVGNVPVIEYARQRLELIPGAGVACHGPVRSILLVSKRAPGDIRTLAADTSSRTSVELCRILLAKKYRVEPEVRRRPPVLEAMLSDCDAALVIGDPALHIDPAKVGYRVLDLGEEWVEYTGLPMVFAVWAGAARHVSSELQADLIGSVRYGREHLEDVIARESAARNFDPDLARRYLTHHIVNELGPRDYEGLRTYLREAAELGALTWDEPVLH